jgi:dTDP-4-dehydrorhamnose reductase
MTDGTGKGRGSTLELWGGVECTVVRVGDEYRNQTEETGHDYRPGDIDLIAELGIRTVRYPILWETIAPDRPDQLDFSWHDERLHMLRERGIRVIGGLVHHGSGPRYTSLVDPDFPLKLGDYAARVAERYPWIQDWTPVNEPLTTARFSGLYGHWYPHGRDYPTFLTCLTNQCLGTLDAMARSGVSSRTRGSCRRKTWAKPSRPAPLRYQAAHENERRWLSFDLLCGRVTPEHSWYGFLRGAGIAMASLDRLATGQAKPDLLGINHYLTSERFLDHRLELYPGQEPGGNRRDRYIDAEAVRVKRLQDDLGIAARLREAWQRYRIPMAITEVHHGCTRDEQLRWFAEVWNEANQVRAEGIDLRAVTAWSMFGNVDWRSLLTRRDGAYDTGIFDVRGPEPRPTIIARAAKAYATGKGFDHPVLDAPGWWKRPSRLYPLERPLQSAAGWRRAQAADHRRHRHAWPRFLPDCRPSGPAALPDQPRRARHHRRGLDPCRSRSLPALGDHQHGRLRPGRRCRARARRLFRLEHRWSRPSCAGLRRTRDPARHLLLRPGVRWCQGRTLCRKRSGPPDRRLRPEQGGGGAAGARDRRACARDPHQRLLWPLGQI